MSAGLTVAIVAFPLSMALGVASGATIQSGLATAIVAGFLISFLGGSRTQIGGPTAAFVVVILSVLQKHGLEGLYIATLLAGIILMIFGIFGLGSLIKYIPQPVIVGFTTAIGFSIVTSQMKDFAGLQIPSPSYDLIDQWFSYFQHLSTTNIMAVSLGAGSLAFLFLMKRYYPNSPFAILSIILGTLVAILFDLDVESVGDRFGTISLQFHSPLNFSWHINDFYGIASSAFAIAFLAGIESLLSAVVSDSMTGETHKPNTELFAQGVANIASAFIGGLPATGAIARTATNIRAGAKTPISGIAHAVFVLILALVCAPLIQYIPFCCLAALLFYVAWNMAHMEEFVRLLFSGFEDVLLLLVTFSLTIATDISTGIVAGVLLSALLFMRRMSKVAQVKHHSINHKNIKLPEGVFVCTIEGPFFFGSASRIKELLATRETSYEVYIINIEDTPFVDSSAIKTLESFIKEIQKFGDTVILCCKDKRINFQLMKQLPSHILPNELRTTNLEKAIVLANNYIKKLPLIDEKQLQMI